MSEILEAIGLSKEELADRVVERVAGEVLEQTGMDDDGEETTYPTRFSRSLQDRVKAKIDEAVTNIAARNVLPNVESYVENICFQETNSWGEKTGEALTFREYLVKRAEAWLVEKVDYDGKAKGDRSNYNWSGTQTRITHLVHEHLHYSIEGALKQALQEANNALAQGLQETVKLKLAELVGSLKVSTTVKRR